MVLTAFRVSTDLRYNVIYEGFRIDNEYHVKDVHVKPTNSCGQTVSPFFETGSTGPEFTLLSVSLVPIILRRRIIVVEIVAWFHREIVPVLVKLHSIIAHVVCHDLHRQLVGMTLEELGL